LYLNTPCSFLSITVCFSDRILFSGSSENTNDKNGLPRVVTVADWKMDQE
jgi:hypothetical protein